MGGGEREAWEVCKGAKSHRQPGCRFPLAARALPLSPLLSVPPAPVLLSLACEQVSYGYDEASCLGLHIPLEAAENREQFEAYQERQLKRQAQQEEQAAAAAVASVAAAAGEAAEGAAPLPAAEGGAKRQKVPGQVGGAGWSEQAGGLLSPVLLCC